MATVLFGITRGLMWLVIATCALATLVHTQEPQSVAGWIQMLISQRFCNLFFNGPPLRHSSDTFTIMLPGLKKMLIRVLARFLHRRLLQLQYLLSHSFRILGKTEHFCFPDRVFFFFKEKNFKKCLKFLVKRFEKCIVLVN